MVDPKRSARALRAWETRRNRPDPPHPDWIWCTRHQDWHSPKDFAHYKKAKRRKQDASCIEGNKEIRKERYEAENPRQRMTRKLRWLYGITAPEFFDKLDDQGGVCAICGGNAGESAGGRLHVDHNHNSGQIRGLLCGRCNMCLGLVEAGFLAKAQPYLDYWNNEDWLDFVDENDLHAKFAHEEERAA